MGYSITPKKLSELQSGRDVVEIEVRVIRKWKNEIKKNPGHFYVDLILIDEENVTIQATINKNIWRKYDEGILEGNTYKMSKFTVSNNEGYQEMATTNAMRIWLDYSTKVTAVELPKIPHNKFTFSSFNDILNLNVNQYCYTDIIGEFAHYHPIHVTKKNEEWTTIDLIDTEGTTLTCSIWTPYTKQIIDIINGYMGASERPILVLQFVQPKLFNEQVTTTTTRGATRIFVNPDLPDVADFKARYFKYFMVKRGRRPDHQVTLDQNLYITLAWPDLQQFLDENSHLSWNNRKADLDGDGQTSQLTQTSSEQSLLSQKANIKSLEQINNGGKAGEFVTKVTILNIDSNVPWYYNSCSSNNCRSKANLESNGMWYCTNKKHCIGKTEGMKSAIPRFQVKFFVTGGTNAFAELMMFDNHINTLVKESAVYLASKQEKMGDKDAIPLELEAFIDKDVIVKIKVSRQYNIECESTRYTVSSITFDRDMIDKWTELFEALEKGKEDADALTGSYVDEFNGVESSNTISSGNSQRKRIYAEVISPITDDLFEVSPLADKESCSKMKTIIKMEKL